ncbi:hypothetical protein DRE_00820 [Drechslerella stenobrocha 248]|uniref:Uncharacterized protein n=1 Tax=Drechslerella stenobrocha 248 TaxID=1043628 RepID=W7HN09_9PEZI|nr:hypothetical protein DRE_00820 [Drechslerella stenobrocha 248]
MEPDKTPAERDSIDLEALPRWHRQQKRPRYALVVAGCLALATATYLLLPESPLGYFTVPETRPRETSMCDYYTQRQHFFNSAASQKTFVKSIVDKAFLGARHPERLSPPVGGAYNGILRSGDWFDVPTDLTKYFDGSQNTTNVGGAPSRVNFFSPSTFTRDGHEYPAGNCRFHRMKDAMYRYFAPILGCSAYGRSVDRYAGPSMKEVHRFMDFTGNFDWMYFIHQFQMAALAADFSLADASVLEVYLVDTFGPRLDKATGKVTPCFENPALEASPDFLPPKLDPQQLADRQYEIAKAMVPNYVWKRDAIPNANPNHATASDRPVPSPRVLHIRYRRADRTPQRGSSGSAPNILAVALGAGIGAAFGVIIIAIAIAYLVIRKRRIAKRESMYVVDLKQGLEREKSSSSSKKPAPNRRVDRSEHGNVVGKPKEQTGEQSSRGHKKTESVGVQSVRSVHFSPQQQG